MRTSCWPARTPAKGEAAAEKIRAEQPKGTVVFAQLDLSDLDSVAAFAGTLTAGHDRLDLLVNNAGVMVPPLGRTKQGFELQFGTNHLGHFALTGRLLPLLEATADARVVSVSSTGQHIGRLDFDGLDWHTRPYQPWAAYGQSKLANMMFTLELQRRLTVAGSHVHAPVPTPAGPRRTCPAPPTRSCVGHRP